MVNPSDLSCLSFGEAAQLRKEVTQLLTRLLANREQSERRMSESGKRDPMKFITGKTSLESAIVSAREMIDELDALASGLQSGSGRPATELAAAARTHRTPVRSKVAARAAMLTAAP
jgi:hypothetical protein